MFMSDKKDGEERHPQYTLLSYPLPSPKTLSSNLKREEHMFMFVVRSINAQ